MSLITSITVQTVAYSLTRNAHFLSTTVNGVSITSSIWGKKDEAWGRKIMSLVNRSECLHNYRYVSVVRPQIYCQNASWADSKLVRFLRKSNFHAQHKYYCLFVHKKKFVSVETALVDTV